MKLLTAAMAAFLFSSAAMAQTKIAIKAGPNFSTAKVMVYGVKQSSSFKPGASLGIQFDVPFDGVLHFSPYAAYNTLGSKTNYKATGASVQTTIHYLQLAPGFSCHFKAGETNTFVFGFSPVLGLTNFGRQKTTTGGATTSEKIQFGYEGTGWFDLGLTGSLGYHFKKMFVEVNYYNSLTNINNNEEFDGISIRHRMLSLNVGYFFR
jgi:Outer membrane protein beta-barrel domain